FQAEDGIRVFHVTGVQTCALPISINQVIEIPKNLDLDFDLNAQKLIYEDINIENISGNVTLQNGKIALANGKLNIIDAKALMNRSEEQRVGKECRYQKSMS